MRRDAIARTFAGPRPGSHAVVVARDGDRIVGNARMISDGVCNAYLVDVWTATPYSRRGIASEMARRLLATVPGQHVALLADDALAFYEQLGFAVEREAMTQTVGSWLNRQP